MRYLMRRFCYLRIIFIQIHIPIFHQVFTFDEIYDIVLIRVNSYNWSYKMRKDILICRCLEFFALQKIGMTTLLIIRGFLDDCCRNRGMTPTLMSYSGLSRVSRGFKWILGTSPRMTIKNVCPRITIKMSVRE